MKTRGLLLSLLAVTAPFVARARVTPDLQPPQKRQVTVDLAKRLMDRKDPDPITGDLASPFNPADFDRPDPTDAPVARTAAGAAKPAAAPLTNRETLEVLSGQINPTGMILRNGSPRLIIGGKPFEVGTRFTATYNTRDYELELTAIDRTTFTLRYRGEEITRPIKPVR